METYPPNLFNIIFVKKHGREAMWGEVTGWEGAHSLFWTYHPFKDEKNNNNKLTGMPSGSSSEPFKQTNGQKIERTLHWKNKNQQEKKKQGLWINAQNKDAQQISILYFNFLASVLVNGPKLWGWQPSVIFTSTANSSKHERPDVRGQLETRRGVHPCIELAWHELTVDFRWHCWRELPWLTCSAVFNCSDPLIFSFVFLFYIFLPFVFLKGVRLRILEN